MSDIQTFECHVVWPLSGDLSPQEATVFVADIDDMPDLQISHLHGEDDITRSTDVQPPRVNRTSVLYKDAVPEVMILDRSMKKSFRI